MANSGHLVDITETFSLARSLLREVYTSSIKHFNVIQDLIRGDTAPENKKLITKDAERLIEKVINSEPVIIVSGQLNSGKTSLINELLGGSYLPTSRGPCTARIVRIKYAEENYLQVCDEHGAPIGETITFKKKVPSEQIALLTKSRENETEVKHIVEVGLNHPMLAHGLQIVDLPGLSESEALNNVVTKVLDGMMQLLIYVIDGNDSLRTQDVTFISTLKNIAPNMDIIFVCNKVEVDLTAMEMDKRDDGSVEESVDKADLTFFKLQKCRLIPPTQQPGLENYHAISCKRVRQARIKKQVDEFTNNFCRFKTAMMNKFSQCFLSHLSQATTIMSMMQKRFCVLFVMEDVVKVKFRDFLSGFHQHLQLFLKAMKEKVKQTWTPLMVEMFQSTLELEMGSVQVTVEELKFQPIVMDNDDSADRLNICRQQVCEYILMLAIERFEVQLSKIETLYNEEVKLNVAKYIDGASDCNKSFLQTYISTTWQLKDFKIDALKSKWVASLRENVNTKLREYYEEMTFPLKGTLNLDTDWKVGTGLVVLMSIDTMKLAADIAAEIHNVSEVGFYSYVFYVFWGSGTGLRLTDDHRNILKEIFPDYCRNLVVTEALSTTVTHGALTLGERIGKGSRMEVFECSDWNLNYNSRCGQSLHLVAKKEIRGSAHPSSALCTHYCRSRLMPDIENVQKVTAVVYDKDWNLCIILPHYDGTLHDVLMAGNTTLEQRMKICSEMIQLCLKASKDGFRLDDLRLNNFLVINSDGVLTVCYNLSKWMNQLAPLPDGGVPFHFAPEVMRGEKHDPDTCDAYSLAVLLLLMAIGRFVRPRWSEAEEAVHRLTTESDPEVMANPIWKDFVDILEANWTGPKTKFYRTLVGVLEKYIAAKPNDRMDISCLSQFTEILHFNLCTKGGGRLNEGTLLSQAH